MLVIKYVVFVSIVSLYYTSVTCTPAVTRVFVRETAEYDAKGNLGAIRIYNNLQELLLSKMRNWLNHHRHHSDPSAVDRYLGFSAKTIGLINTAVTILFDVRAGNARLFDNLLAAFFYACDIEHMRDPRAAADRVLNVEENYGRIIENLRIDERFVFDRDYEDEFARIATQLVKSYSVHGWYRVSVPIMKNRMFRDEDNVTVRKLRGRFTAEYWEIEAESYETETDPVRVCENHVTFIGKIIPDLFGFAYNHVQLVTKLREHDLGEWPEAPSFAPSSTERIVEILQILVRRYYKFKNVPPPAALFADALIPLQKFIDPRDDYDHLSVLDYLEMYFEDDAWELTNKALAVILSSFGGENAEEWKNNRTIRVVDYTAEENVDKPRLLQLIERNIRDADEFHKLLDRYITY